MSDLRTDYRFIRFVSTPAIPNVWACLNRKSGDALGGVEWYAPWRQYVFSADEMALFSHDCLADVADFLKQLNAEPSPPREARKEKR